jgi:hypothetical protein
VHAEHVFVKVGDYNVEFAIDAKDVHVDVGLFALLSRRLHLGHLGIEDLAFHMRHKVQSSAGQEERLAAFPRIEGFADPPLYQGPEPAKIPDDQYNLWTIDIEDVDAEVSDIWIMEYRFQGSARATGGFRLKPARRLEVRPALLEIRSGRLDLGEHPVAEELSGSIACRVRDHDIREHEGFGVLKEVTAATRLEATATHLDFLNVYQKPGALRISGQGRLSTDTRLERGVLSEDSSARFVGETVRVETALVTLTAPATFALDMQHSTEESSTESQSGASPPASPRFRVFAKEAKLLASEAPEVPPATLRDPELAAWLGNADLSGTLEMAGFEVEIPEAKLSDVRLVNAWAGQRLLSSGKLSASLSLNREPSGKIRGQGSADVKAFGLVLDDNVIPLNGSVRLSRVRYDPDSKKGQGAINVQIDWLSVPGGEAEEDGEPLWLSARSDDAVWSLDADERFNADFHIGGKVLEPLLPMLIKSDVLEFGADAVLDFEKTTGTVHVRKNELGLSLDFTEFESGDLKIDGALTRSQGAWCGAFLVRTSLVKVGVEIEPSGTSVSPLVGESWLSGRRPRCGA